MSTLEKNANEKTCVCMSAYRLCNVKQHLLSVVRAYVSPLFVLLSFTTSSIACACVHIKGLKLVRNPQFRLKPRREKARKARFATTGGHKQGNNRMANSPPKLDQQTTFDSALGLLHWKLADFTKAQRKLRCLNANPSCWALAVAWLQLQMTGNSLQFAAAVPSPLNSTK